MRAQTKKIAVAASMVIAMCNIALASSDPVFVDYRTVGPNGQYYSVVRRLGGPRHEFREGPVEILLAKRADGSEPVRAAKGKVVEVDAPENTLSLAFVVKSTVGVRDGDQILARIALPKPPRNVLICPAARAFVCVDEHGMNLTVEYGGPAIQAFAFSGKRLVTKGLNDLFDKEEVLQFETATFGVYWMRDCWVAGNGKSVVLVLPREVKNSSIEYGFPTQRAIRLLNPRTGKIRLGGSREVLDALNAPPTPALSTAIELAAAMKLEAAIESLKKLSESKDKEIRSLARDALESIRKFTEPD